MRQPMINFRIADRDSGAGARRLLDEQLSARARDGGDA